MRMLHLCNMDELYSENPDAIVVNYATFNDPDFAARINDMVYSQNTIDDIGFVAKCSCENLIGNAYIGTTCPRCRDVVSNAFVTNLKHKIWIGVPPGIKYFIHPIIYINLAAWLSRGSGDISYLDDILNPKGVLPEDVAPHIEGRGFNYFYENFNYIIEFFLNIYPKTRNKKQVPYIRMLLAKYKDSIFCTKLPLLSNQLHPISKGGKTLRYTDTSSKSILDSVINFSTLQLASITTVVSKAKLNKLTYIGYKNYITYITDIIQNKMAGKYGHFRKHMYGCRLHGTFRAVIAPFVGPHRGDEIHIPWIIGVNTFKLHILNLLISTKKYTFIAALDKVNEALVMYNPEVDMIMQKLIKEAGYFTKDKEGKKVWVDIPGVPCLFNRNPSLGTGSILLVYITKVKPGLKTIPADLSTVDIEDSTITVSPLCRKCWNSDHDGDELNGLTLYETGATQDFLTLHPSSHILSYKEPKISDMISLPNQNLIMLNSWLYDE